MEDVDSVGEGISLMRVIRRGIRAPITISGDVIYASDIGYSDSVLAPDLIVVGYFEAGGTFTNVAGTGGTGGTGDARPESDRKNEPRGRVAESCRATPLRCREPQRSLDESTNEEAIKARARVVPEIEERLSQTEGEGEGRFKGALLAFGCDVSGGGAIAPGAAECPI